MKYETRSGVYLKIVLGTVLGFFIAEGAVRLLGYPRPPLSPPRVEGKIPVLPLGGGLFVYQPNSSFSYRYDPADDPEGYFGPDGRLVYEINNAGFRGPTVPEGRIPGTTRVLCLGDSYTFGEGVHGQDTYPSQLERALNEEAGTTSRRYEVINAGVQALGTRLEALLLRHLLMLEPDTVILGFFMNDAMPDAETIRIQEQTVEELEVDRRQPSRIFALIQENVRSRRRQRAYLTSIRSSFEGVSWDSCRAQLGRMKTMTDERGIRFLVVIFPVLWGLEGDYPLERQHAKVKTACSALGCESLDLLPVFRGKSSRSLWAHPTDPHPNRRAHGIASSAIADYLLHPLHSEMDRIPARNRK